jgi:hypothetical protein
LEFGKTRELDEVDIMFVLNPRNKYRLFETSLVALRTDLESLVQGQDFEKIPKIFLQPTPKKKKKHRFAKVLQNFTSIERYN